ncbi:MAG: Na+/H+ antiporter NhaA [Gammaproteobacteria bacterium]|nr:Na+/H+ antiporter NhaA [Gammaproteobacteria bacterium]
MAPVKNFLRLESAGGIVLMVSAVLAIIAANSPLAGVYGHLLDMPLTVAVGEAAVSKPIVLWINDGLMAIFFLLIGLELKREVLDGELSTARHGASDRPARIRGVRLLLARARDARERRAPALKPIGPRCGAVHARIGPVHDGPCS